MRIKLIDLHRPNADLFNYKYIWPRGQIINEELQGYVQPHTDPNEFAELLQKRPDGTALISKPTSDAMRNFWMQEFGFSQKFMSVLMTTHKRFAFKYGTIKIDATFDDTNGRWCAGWLLREFQQWPQGKPMLPECDVIELVGDGVVYGTAHYYPTDAERKHVEATDPKAKFKDNGMVERQGTIKKGGGPTRRVYELKWTEQTMDWLVDGQVYHSINTPEDFKGHMHFLLNIAVGGVWPTVIGNHAPDGSEATSIIHDITIETDDLLYTPVDGMEVSGAPSSVIDSAQSSTLPPLITKDPEIEQVINNAQSGQPDQLRPDTSAANVNERHVQLTMMLLNLGWMVENNRDYKVPLLDEFLTGNKYEPEGVLLNRTAMTMSQSDLDKAWNGIVQLLSFLKERTLKCRKYKRQAAILREELDKRTADAENGATADTMGDGPAYTVDDLKALPAGQLLRLLTET